MWTRYAQTRTEHASQDGHFSIITCRTSTNKDKRWAIQEDKMVMPGKSSQETAETVEFSGPPKARTDEKASGGQRRSGNPLNSSSKTNIRRLYISQASLRRIRRSVQSTGKIKRTSLNTIINTCQASRKRSLPPSGKIDLKMRPNSKTRGSIT